MVKSDKRSELEAKLIAGFVSLGCLVFFILVARPKSPPQPSRKISAAPVATPQPPIAPRPQVEQFRGVPGRWASIDFRHHSYGPYRFFGGRKINLKLKNGEYEYDFSESDRGWFWVRDVYYVDITGDQIPEAIVNLLHVECGGGSCDGGSELLFIYSKNAEGKLRELFQYETGSYAYGCGLKSMTLEGKEVRLELFGRCPRPAMAYEGPGKYMVKDLTQLVFRYSSRGFLHTRTEFVSTDVVDVRSHKAEVHINE